MKYADCLSDRCRVKSHRIGHREPSLRPHMLNHSARLLFARMTPDGATAASREIEMPTRLIVARP